jgi:NAD(P)-dependent dehydrogenase (short-subunit alcohol dehydrogenase family)
MNCATKVSLMRCDVANEDDVKALAIVVERDHGRLDVVINNAGYLDTGWQPITKGDAEDWKRVFDVNVFGVLLRYPKLAPSILKSLDGLKVVIGITSMSSHWAGHSIAMGMSKLAFNRGMEFLGGQYPHDELMAYSLHPGGVLRE